MAAAGHGMGTGRRSCRLQGLHPVKLQPPSREGKKDFSYCKQTVGKKYKLLKVIELIIRLGCSPFFYKAYIYIYVFNSSALQQLPQWVFKPF